MKKFIIILVLLLSFITSANCQYKELLPKGFEFLQWGTSKDSIFEFINKQNITMVFSGLNDEEDGVYPFITYDMQFIPNGNKEVSYIALSFFKDKLFEITISYIYLKDKVKKKYDDYTKYLFSLLNTPIHQNYLNYYWVFETDKDFNKTNYIEENDCTKFNIAYTLISDNFLAKKFKTYKYNFSMINYIYTPYRMYSR